MEGARWIGATAAVVIALGAGLFFGSDRSVPPPPVSIVSGSTTAGGEPSLATVHVSGAVRDPGLVRVDAGARVADAVSAAGGLTTHADPGALNLAAPVSDGMQVVVPRLDEAGGATARTDTDGRVRINSATAAELEALPGVGPVLAARIAEYRDEHGPFTVAEDLLDVPGIGEAKLAGMRDAVALP